MNTKRLATDGVLATVALTIFILELQLPHLVPIPGVKLGLANIITVVAMFFLGPIDAAAILLVRILLGSMFAGQTVALLYSLAGGLLCYGIMLLLRKLVSPRQIWVCSVFGAIAHNLGQITVAIWITGTPGVLAYLPLLMISGIIAGLFTGLCAQFTVGKLIKK